MATHDAHDAQEAHDMDQEKGLRSRVLRGKQTNVPTANIIADTEESGRRNALWTTTISGIALFSDGYNSEVVGNLALVFEGVYPDFYTSVVSSRCSDAFLVGQVFGCAILGHIADRYSRKAGILTTTALLVLGSILSAASSGTTLSGEFWMLTIMRGLTGFAAGGELPTCSVGSVEASDDNAWTRKHRGIIMALVYTVAIDTGIITSGAVVIILIKIFGPNHYRAVWRVSLALGAVVPLVLVYFRIKMAMSTSFAKNSFRRGRGAKFWMLVMRKYWLRLFGACITWFAYEITAFPFGLFASTIISNFAGARTVIQNIGWGTLMVCFIYPGSIGGGFAMDVWGRKNQMIFGFTIAGIFGLALGFSLPKLNFAGIVLLYGLFVCFLESGAAVTQSLVTTESFPTAVRGQMAGFCGTIGRAGGAIGSAIFIPINTKFQSDYLAGNSKYTGNQVSFIIGGCIALFGALMSLLFITDYHGRPLEAMDEDFAQYMAGHGYGPEYFGNQNTTLVDAHEITQESTSSSVDEKSAK